jgi:hypothetical protein
MDDEIKHNVEMHAPAPCKERKERGTLYPRPIGSALFAIPVR